MKEALLKIINHYGVMPQLKYFQSEVYELGEAIWEYQSSGWDFDYEDFEKASKVNSNTQLYKQAGNSIVVNVLMAIFKEFIK